MILELVAVCTLSFSSMHPVSGAREIIPPPEWKVERIIHAVSSNLCMGNTDVCGPRTTVTLRRTVQPGETIKAPEGCEMTLEQKPKQGE